MSGDLEAAPGTTPERRGTPSRASTRTGATSTADTLVTGSGDRWPWLVALLALVVYLPHGFAGSLTRDIGLYSYAGQRFADGVAPYEGVFNRAGPLAHALPGVGAWIADRVGLDDLLGMRLLFMLFAIATVVATYLLGRDALRSRWGGLAAAAGLLVLEGFTTYATYGPREKTPMVLFTVVAVLALGRRRWWLAGAMTALATLTWQPVFLGLVIAAVAGIVLGAAGRGPRLRAAVGWAVGGAVPSLAVVAAYAAIGQLDLFWQDFVVINAKYTDQAAIIWNLPAFVTELSHGYGWTTWLFLVGGPVQAVFAVGAVRSSRRHELDGRLMGVTGALFVGGVLWSMRAFNGWPDNFFMLPGAALGAAALVTWLGRRLADRDARLATAVPLAWTAFAVVAALVFSVTARDDGLDLQTQQTEAVLGALPADARIAGVNSTQAQVLGHRLNISRLMLFTNGTQDFLDATYPGGSQGFADHLAQEDPTLVTVGHQSSVEFLMPTVLQHYRCVGQVPGVTGWDWYVSDSTPAATVAKVRSVIDDHSCLTTDGARFTS